MSEIRGLLKRDFFLIMTTARKRFFTACMCVFILINIFYITGGEGYLFKQLSGVSRLDFVEMMQFPYYTVLQYILPAIICIDFVRKDLYFHAGSILIRLKCIRNFWLSKLIISFLVCIFFSFIMLIISIFFVLISSLKVDETVLSIYLRNAVYSCMGGFIVLCVYELFSLIITEISSFIACLTMICLGLPYESRLYFINNFMIKREEEVNLISFASGGISLIYMLCVLIFTFLTGSMILKKIDVYKKGRTGE